MTIGDALAKIRESGVSPISGQALLAYVTSRPREWLLAHPEETLETQQASQFDALLKHAAQGEPLAYLIGEKEFCGLTFAVTPDVLIPRPETEMLVEAAQEWQSKARKPALSVIDVGTGSGAIAIAVAVRLPQAKVVGIDRSVKALDVARENAARHGVDQRVTFVQGDMLIGVDSPFDIILANLPYIPTETLRGLDVSRWEPSLALDGGADGLNLVRRLVDQAAARLAPGGMLALEIQADQGERVSALCRAAFSNAAISVRKDLAGLDRVVTVGLRP